MIRSLRLGFVLVVALAFVPQVPAQDSKAAKATREKLKQVIDEFEAKDVGTKALFEDINDKLEKPIRFKIDNTSGISNNTKLSFKKAKKITVEKLLNDLSDQNGFGWYVFSNEGNNKEDGKVVIRKSDKKERGYEGGKEPKKTSSLPLPAAPERALAELLRGSDVRMESVFVISQRK